MTEMRGDQKRPREEAPDTGNKTSPVGVFGILGSVFRAWFGVQSEKNRQRDFSSNDPTPFIVAGLIFAAVMIIGVIIAVNIALSTAGK